MTRDEAIGRWRDVMRKAAKARELDDAVAAEVDGFVALGLLKLDEPKTKMALFCDSIGWPQNGVSYNQMTYLLNKAGLKIVEV